MNIATRLILNIPIFFGALAGIFFDRGYAILGWVAFIIGAVGQGILFNQEK